MVCFLRLLSRTSRLIGAIGTKRTDSFYLVESVSDPRHRAFSINSTYIVFGLERE